MSIKTVLSVLDAKSFKQDLKHAVEFCQQRDAHLTALLISLDPDFYISEYQVYSEVYVQEQQRIAQELSRNAATLRESLAATGLSYDVQDIFTEIAWATDDIAERALYSDLVLIGGQAASNHELRRLTVGGALFHSPTPILFNRTEKPIVDAIGTVLVAWDSSDAAARSIHQAMGFLKAASSVHITLVDPLAVSSVNGEEPGADVARFLARHGVKVEVDRVASGGRKVDEVLLQHAGDVGAKLIVMGAYRHSRLQERVFGGVTRSMLETADVALFLSH